MSPDADPAISVTPTGKSMVRLPSGVDIAYRIDRAGPVGAAARPWLVFAHALGGDLAQWEPQVAKFSQAFNVLRYDLRGHGASSAPKGGYALDALADDLRGLLDALRVPHGHFVGSSLGGVVGQLAALRFPLRISSLTLVGTTSRATPDIKRQLQDLIGLVNVPQGLANAVQPILAQSFTSVFRTRHVDKVADIGRRIRSTPIDGFVGCARALAEANLTARLASIGCPVLVIASAGDRCMPALLGEEIARSVHGARLKVVPNAANLMNIEQPDAFNGLLADFLVDLSRLT
ncbi:MAG TPA: alpha/beta fold hydrolase [Burkholderiaceae bacterium]|nr:alpha/beta fold hydrolase [Burkholderiaceae bacterium]